MRRRPLLIASVVCLCGCPDPNTYGTARTLAPGDVQLQASMSGLGASASGDASVSAGLPSLGARAGVADRIDIGVRLVDMLALGGDAKFNLVRGRFDMALDPTVQAFYSLPAANAIVGVGTVEARVPLVMDVNFNDATTLVLTPGPVATVATRKASDAAINVTPLQNAFTSSGVGAQLGVGLNIHQTDTFSWQPEVTAWHQFDALDSWFLVFGIGMNIGPQPDFSDLSAPE